MNACCSGCSAGPVFSPSAVSTARARGHLGERQAGEMRLAVDQHGAGAAAALAATEFRRMIADALAQRGEQTVAALDEHRDLAAVVAELQRRLGHRRSAPRPSNRRRRCTPATSRRYQALAIGSVAGRGPFGRGGDSAADSRLVEVSSLPTPVPRPWRGSRSAPSRHRLSARRRRGRRRPEHGPRSRSPRRPSGRTREILR